ncbi:PspC domain-containing protein [Microbacterium dextranolyticum]|uniref:PspC domain-containing protein n=1 Tax=Microbacterium dextranolyticum TaxID=36806 RepID=UPI00195626C8|nr:PspC domain-containing protein [Microbacterium dextranolyticum]MBM7463885.1 phage shock protein PspC (stress-responsive transcriptional regulator)/uncharacterized membrane protein [Microbacterium dextranolyticum]
MTTTHSEEASDAAAPDAAQPTAPHAPNRAGDRLFSWTSGLGLVRGDAWIGGVAAGIAARLRIDPLIVRGVLVVAALFGFPVMFFYAIAWAVLPDLEGRIPLHDALRGRFETVQLGILIVAVIGLIPVVPTVLFVGGIPAWMFSPGVGGWSPLSAIAVSIGVGLVVTMLFIIVRAARRTARTVDPAPPSNWRAASAAPGDPVPSTVDSGSGPASTVDAEGVDAAGFAASTPASLLTPPPGEAPPASDDAAYTAWRAQHAAWREQQDAWRRQQQDADRAARDRARQERQERAAAFTADAEERRRIRRLTKPRTPFAYVATVVGLAAIAGTVAALQHDSGLSAARGLFVAALVLALAMIVAGAFRRRSGFLAFVTVLALGAGLVATAVPVTHGLHIGYSTLSNIAPRDGASASAPFVQPWGTLWISIADTGREGELHVDKRNAFPGSAPGTTVTFAQNVALEVELTTRDTSVTQWNPDSPRIELMDLVQTGRIAVATLPDGRTRYTGTLGDDSGTPQKLVIDQDGGSIMFQRADDDTQNGEDLR